MRKRKDKEKISKEQLLTELSECREDERNCKDQMVQVIATASTILGVLFGSTYFSFDGDGKKAMYFSKVVFYLSVAVFCVAFTYMIVLGISTTLRYYYMQKIEDLLSLEDENFLHWGSYIAPIITRNRKHVLSTYTLLHYICFSLSAVGAVAFSVGIIIVQYIQIKNKTGFDKLVFSIAIIGVIGAILIFYRTTAKAKNMAIYAEKTAIFNRKKRQNPNDNSLNSYRAFRHYVRYFIYPKRQDMEKPLLIIGIFIIFSCMRQGIQLAAWNWKQLLVSLLVFEALAYQARYQINDLRDIEEDKNSDNRLFPKNIAHNAYIIELSAILAGIKIVLALVCTYFLGGKIRGCLYIELLLLAIITIVYEWVRDTHKLEAICFCVGSGYALRFIVAVTAVDSGMIFNKNEICIMISLWALGSMASVAQWVAEVAELKSLSVKDYGKKHYIKLSELIKDRYNQAKERIINGKIYPLRECGKFQDIWNIGFIISFLSLSCDIFLQKELLQKEWIGFLIIGELISWLILLILIKKASYKKIVYFNIIFLFVIAGKSVLAYLSGCEMGVVICIFQCIVLGTYFYVTYRPEFKKIDVKNILINFMSCVLGKEAMGYIMKDINSKLTEKERSAK